MVTDLCAGSIVGKRPLKKCVTFKKNRPNPGNGPTMRAIPFGFVNEKDIDRFATINANATHPNSKAIASSICIARAAEYLIVKKRILRILSTIV